MNQFERDEAPAVLPPVRIDTIRRRMIIIAVGLAVGLTLATGRAVVLQTVDAAALQREASKNYVRNETLDGWRGDITDRNGKLLAVTVHRWAITVDPQEVKEPARTAEILAPIVGMPALDVAQRCDPSWTGGGEDGAAIVNPAGALARTLSAPMARTLSRLFEVPRDFYDRRLDIMEKFFQLEQLQSPAVFPIVETLADGAEQTATAIAADVHKLRFFPTHGRRFAYIARDLDDAAVQRLGEARDAEARRCKAAQEAGEPCWNALASVWSRPEPRRYYPKRELGSQVLGLVGRDNAGLSGMERALDAFLAGGLHRVRTLKDQSGRRIFVDGLPADIPLEAAAVELTIDQQIQAITERELARACLASGARAGYAIVTRPRTGEVLAAANFPTYNPNTAQDWFQQQAPLKNEKAALAERRKNLAWAAGWPGTRTAYGDLAETTHQELVAGLDQEIDAYVEYAHAYPNSSRSSAFLDVYEPGSIMKVFTVAAALDAGVIDLDTVFDLEGGRWAIGDAEDNTIHDITKLVEGNAALILKKSSNIGAAKIAFLLGATQLEKYLRDFGFGATTRSGFPGEARGLLRPSEQWVPVELANVSFGQGMAVSGIQLAMALGALANEGRLMEPRLVARILDGNDNVLETFEPAEVRRVVDPRTARTVLDLMQGVIEPDGTGRRAYIPEWPVAGKTGTGQKPHLRRRGYSEEMWVNTFFGVAPANDPELAIVILIDEPKGERHGGGLIAAPAFRRIMEQSLAYLGTSSPLSLARRQVWLEPEVLATRRAEPSTRQVHDPIEALLPPIAASPDGQVPAPDLRGLTIGEVRRLAAKMGLSVSYLGTGIATHQSVAPNDLVRPDIGLVVTFTSRLPDAATRSGSEAPPRAGEVAPEAVLPGAEPGVPPLQGARPDADNAEDGAPRDGDEGVGPLQRGQGGAP
ncbi:MAG: transpeptidase family protein [Deltaproteobacteria bacterium]|nr:transpeptidase family protein [Deltaproteobacteria bacterium]